jgi:hypothetical protein
MVSYRIVTQGKDRGVMPKVRNKLEKPKFVFTGRTEVRVGGVKVHI